MSRDIKIKRALFSLWEKSGSELLAKSLADTGTVIIASGGTAKYLASKNIEVKEVADITGYGSMLGGRVKTLHPKIFAGILADRDNEEHRKDMSDAGIEEIDLIAVNFYPFEDFVSDGSKDLSEAIEMIDIGGPSMLRASAKNHSSVVPVCRPEQFIPLSEELTASGGFISSESRIRLAREAFAYTSNYEAAISNYFQRNGDKHISSNALMMNKISSLRYGENPHQTASLYSSPQMRSIELDLLNGKELSYNNLLDLDSALGILKDLKENGVVILKHGNPCGCSEMTKLSQSYKRALKTDTVSSFGSVIGLKGKVDSETATSLSELFIECIVAPEYDSEALKLLKKKKNLRVLTYDRLDGPEVEYRAMRIGILMQERDSDGLDIYEAKIVTERKPTDSELTALSLAWRVSKHVKSNAIVYCDKEGTLGIGAGQMSRVDSSRLAALKAHDANLSLKGAVAASDAFFPFRDGIDVIAKEGISAIVQPGGSIRDEEVIEAANENNIAMLFTGFRHFRH
ncbi:MAG: bifunctional phosphoribosylaminoimidazolecarboxamide formyltransferase/IMP cyclohydrolase [Candidatus Marinimicrobia bacterium]|nr:bifunctional phosphoribosylaminoimidazolecarboxamide formyltransferase/IMP cyclohydrolase [Candidatus Neomarinimicrobiota bacterium]